MRDEDEEEEGEGERVLEDMGEVIPTGGVGGRNMKEGNYSPSCEMALSAFFCRRSKFKDIFKSGKINNLISECPGNPLCYHISARRTIM